MEWWMWLTGGLVLLVVELVTPSGFFVMFFGLGALTVGVLTRLALAGEPWAQWLIFTVVSVVYLLLFRGRVRRGLATPPANVDTLVGELAIPRERILPGEVGRVDLRGTLWNARNDASALLEPGQRCRVTGLDGLVLFVQPE
ncbi:MAG: NfeD family protein [Acidobacteria bacterium]|nr:NfeD family protein [Acidobacteriota bacterium]